MNKQLQAIAAALGATFSDKYEHGDRGIITMPNGVEIWATVGSRGNGTDVGKISFSPRWPDHIANKDLTTRATSQRDFLRGTDYFDGINVAASKTPETIAKDVQRRFLPVVNPMWEKCVEWVAQQERSYTGMRDNEALARELFKYDGTGRVYGSLQYAGAEYMCITVNNLNQDQARKLAAFLQTL